MKFVFPVKEQEISILEQYNEVIGHSLEVIIGGNMSKVHFFCSISPEGYYCPACAINRGFGGSMHTVRFGLKHKHICIDCKNDYYEEDYEDFCEKDNNGLWILKSKK